MKRFATLVTTMMFATAVFAAEHQIKMVNSGKDGIMAFEPGFIQVAKGDTVKFIKADPSHNSSSFLTPKAASAWNGKMDEEIVVKLDTEGVYPYQCDPHKSMVMVGLIQVGKPVNLEDAKKEAANFSKTLAMNKDRLTRYVDQAK